MRTKRKQSPEDKLDRAIEKLYYTHGNGRRINILDIGKLYADVRAAHIAGQDLDSAVKAAVAKWCEP